MFPLIYLVLLRMILDKDQNVYVASLLTVYVAKLARIVADSMSLIKNVFCCLPTAKVYPEGSVFLRQHLSPFQTMIPKEKNDFKILKHDCTYRKGHFPQKLRISFSFEYQ